ncbi:MAG: peroxide stress protein YaaA, partial [Aquiluna sp.]
ALERYTGVLYDAIDFESLSVEAKRRAGELLFIQSALFGLLPAMEQIPFYRFSAGSKLQGINLKQLWMEAHQAVWPRLVGPVLDMRSKAYVELNPVPADRTSWFVEVVDQDGKALNHFNKKAKGLFVRQALEDGLAGIDDLPKVAKSAGMSAEIESGKVTLRVPKFL